MRERVAAYAGDLITGATPGGGFRVWARIPLPAAPANDSPADAADEPTVRVIGEPA